MFRNNETALVGTQIVTNEKNEEIYIEPEFEPLFKKFKGIAAKRNIRLLCYDLLEEYEPLFPQTIKARVHFLTEHEIIIRV